MPPPITKRVRTGYVLYKLGQLSLPIGMGVLIGFWAGERRWRLLPDLVEALLAGYVLALILVLLGSALRGKALKQSPEGIKVARRTLFSLGGIGLALLLTIMVYWLQQPAPLTRLSETEFNQLYHEDAAGFQALDASLKSILDTLSADKALFVSDRLPGPQQESLLRSSWAAFYHTAFALDQIRAFYQDWYRFDPSRVQRHLHLRAFLLSHSAELALYEHSTRLVKLVNGNRHAETFLDARHIGEELPENSFAFLRRELQGAREQARVHASRQYLNFLEMALDGRTEATMLGCSWLWDSADRLAHAIAAHSPLDLDAAPLFSEWKLLKTPFTRSWFDAQKSVATFMGNTRLKRPGVFLITAKQKRVLNEHLEPGDILLSRKNWYLSNAGLPGFWPHAVLYLGSPDKLAAYFEDPDVLQWVHSMTGDSLRFDELLATRYPLLWHRYEAGEAGEPFRVAEGISHGVVFNTLRVAVGDYVAALRPRLDKRAKAQAILEAFSHLGKPYDYDFDFATDHALVCTEFVWRSYRPAPGKAGLNLPARKIAGRMTLPANDIAATYAREKGTDRAQLEFVYFLDASEAEAKAFPADEPDFVGTLARSKWSFLQN